MATRKKQILLLASAIAVVIFWMGFVMGEVNYRHNIIAAYRNGDNLEALKLWNEMKKSGHDVRKNPLYFLTAAKILAKKGNAEGALFNIDKAFELLAD